MIRIFRDLIERELTDHVRSGAVADDSVGLQLYWSIIEEFGGARQYLSNESDAIVRFHRFDLDIHIHITCAEQQLARWRSDTADTRHYGLIEGVEYKGRD